MDIGPNVMNAFVNKVRNTVARNHDGLASTRDKASETVLRRVDQVEWTPPGAGTVQRMGVSGADRPLRGRKMVTGI
jgi:hypothetical protein